MTRKVGTVAFLISLAAASAGAIAATRGSGAGEAAATTATPERTAQAAKKKPIPYDAHDLFIETNATDGDAGLQMFLDGEDWKRTKLRDTKERTLADVKAKGRLHNFGLTELFFEAAEPSFDEFPFSRFKKRFPEGKYTFRGRTVEGRKLVGSDRLSHVIPTGPVITSPTEGEVVNPNNFKVSWQPVTEPAGVEIVRYIVVVTQEDPDEREVSMDLLPGATSASIPGEFLRPGTETKVEVLARDKSGNQTITEIPFRTK